MRLFGLIGYPLTHSFSKKYFSAKFEKEGIGDCRYELFSIASIDQLKEVLSQHPELTGINVTIPYKEQVLSFLDEKDEVVRKIKACNCITITTGKLKGFNTDVTGFERSLKEKLQPHHQKALVLGTGGASKAVEFVLRKLGILFRNVSRKPSVHNYSYEQLTPALIADHTLIINTTPLGTFPAVNEAPPLPYEALTHQHYLFDLVYNPAKTLFLQKGEEKGAVIKNGYDMLVIQAEESWRIWNE
ncbi:MAG: shikimate dehydrogenase [Chitinophagaceae bacterium]|nr:shikimate dehydrogenase [Chitinophagaceae bacterium]